MIKVLIVDDEEDILDINTFCVEECFKVPHKIDTAICGNDAIQKLASNSYDICICDHNMPNGNGAFVCDYISTNKLKTKHVLCSSVLPEEYPLTYNNEKLFFNIVKPNITEGIENLYKKLNLSTIYNEQENTYVPIAGKLLYLIGELPCDIYLKLSDNKYVHTFNSGDLFKIDDLEKYKVRLVDIFYVKQNGDENKIINVLNNSMEKLLNTIESTHEEKLLLAHEHVTSILKSFGITEATCEMLKNTINSSLADILKSEYTYDVLKKMYFLGSFPSQLYVMQSMLCGLLTKKISWCSEPTLHKQITASFFQDLTLDSIKLIQIYDYDHFCEIKEKLSSKEIETYLEHPTRAREFVLKIKNLPPDVDKIILEQHEMPHGNGFPRKLNSHTIGPVSAMFILTGLVAKSLLLEPLINVDLLLDRLKEKGYNKGNFKVIYLTLEEILK